MGCGRVSWNGWSGGLGVSQEREGEGNMGWCGCSGARNGSDSLQVV